MERQRSAGRFNLAPEQLSARQFDFVAKKPGKYVLELKVFDGKRLSEPATVEVIVVAPKPLIVDIEQPSVHELPGSPAVAPPPAKSKAIGTVINGDKPFKVGDTIVLDGSKSIVSEADTPRFFWIQLDELRSPQVRVLKPDQSRPFSEKRADKLNFPVQSFVAAENGSYKFVLQIRTADGAIESEPVTFQVGEAGAPSIQIRTPTRATTPMLSPPATQGPVARVIASKAEVAVGDEVTLDGRKSTGPDGATLTYTWTPVPGKKFPDVIRGVDGPVARFSAEREGDYGVILLVSDGKRQSLSEPIMIKVVGGEKPPVVELAPTQKCNVGETIVMEAKIKDASPAGLKFRWSCIDPKTIVIPEKFASTDRFRFSPQTPGTYLFQVEVTNAKGQSAVATTQIGVKNAAILKPTAIIKGPETANVGDKITLNGESSGNPNKAKLSYRWTEETDGAPKIKEQPKNGEWTFKITEPGRYVISLSVNDGTSDSDPAKYAIDVAAPAAQNKPVAKISGAKVVDARTEAEFSAEGSTGDGQLLYFWNQSLDGGSPELTIPQNLRRGKTLRVTPAKPGSYTLTLEVMDQNNQRSPTASFTFEVKGAAATPPTAAATLLTADPSSTGKDVRLTANKSFDPAGATLTYRWKQTKGPQQLIIAPKDTAQEVIVTPTTAGTYEMQVTVFNADLESAPAQVTFKVAATSLPQAVIGEIQPPAVGETVVLDGSGSKSPNGAAGDQLQYLWKQKEPANEPVRWSLGDEKKSKLQFVVPAEGTYVFELTVNDGNDWSEPQVIRFQAKGQAKNIPPVAVVEKPVVSTEVGVATSIDASASNDPDKAPNRSASAGAEATTSWANAAPILKFTPPAVGTLTFEVSAFDGKDYSPPFQVTVNVLAGGVLPVSVRSSPHPIPQKSPSAALPRLPAKPT